MEDCNLIYLSTLHWNALGFYIVIRRGERGSKSHRLYRFLNTICLNTTTRVDTAARLTDFPRF